MIPLAIDAFKRFVPYIAIAAILALAWFHGYSTAHNEHVAYVAQLQAESDALLKQATESNLAKAKQIDESNHRIEVNANANRQIIETLADHNRDLASRVRIGYGSGRCSVSNNTSATSASHAANTGSWTFFDPVIQLAERADTTAEIARACQEYVKSLEALK